MMLALLAVSALGYAVGPRSGGLIGWFILVGMYGACFGFQPGRILAARSIVYALLALCALGRLVLQRGGDNPMVSIIVIANPGICLLAQRLSRVKPLEDTINGVAAEP